MVKANVNRWQPDNVARVRGPPQRGGFEAVLNRFKPFIPPTLGVWSGERYQRSMDGTHRPNRLVRPLFNLLSPKGCVHWKHNELISMVVFETGNREQKRGE